MCGTVTKWCLILVTPWTVACQAPLSVGFPRQEYRSGLPFPSPGYLPNQGSNLGLLCCRQILYQLRYQGTHNKHGSIQKTKGWRHNSSSKCPKMDWCKQKTIHKRTKQKRTKQNLDNHNGVITQLEPDILECEVKWTSGSITMNKASGGDGNPIDPFQILKHDAVKVLHTICQQIWKTQQCLQDQKKSVFIAISKKDNAKEC